MVSGLLDTVIVVDLLRSHPPARSWIAQQERLGVTPIVWLEILDGVGNLHSQRRATELLRHFELVDLLPMDFEWAILQATKLRLSHGVDAMDCMIASAAHRLGVPLYTANLKHFVPMIGTLACQPY